MKALWRSFTIFLRQIWEDAMLFAVCFTPLLVGFVFRFGIPFLEKTLCSYFDVVEILVPYYLLIDLFLCLIASYMFCFVSALVMLTEFDENLSVYLCLTPISKKGYIFSRLGIPALLSFFISIPLMILFSLSSWKISLILISCFLSSMLSVSVALLIFSFSHNRVEGMALGKLAGIYLLGLYVPFFIVSPLQYLFAPLPSFWLARLLAVNDYGALIPALLTLAIWTLVLYRKFERKLV